MPYVQTTDAQWIANLALYQLRDEKGEPDGYAELDADGLVPDDQLPASAGGGAVSSVNGQTGTVVLNSTDVGAIPTTAKAAANGVATLDNDGQVPASQLANAGGVGGGAVSSVNGRVGAVDLTLNDVLHGFVRVDPNRAVATNAAAALTITTPDGSGQVVEPAIEYIPQGWNGHKFWALITGYTNGNAATENPCIYYSDDGITFTPVPGAAFPLVGVPANSPVGNNADPELRLGPDGNLHGFFIKYNFPAGSTGVYWFTSANGVTWTTPQLLFQNVNSTELCTGPMVLYDKTNVQWVMWYVHGLTGGNSSLVNPVRKRTCAGTSPGGTWSSATTCAVTGLPAGRSPWEMHVERRGDQLHLVTTLCDNGTGGGNTTVHFGVSDDQGASWRLKTTPILSPSIAPGWDSGIVYRGDIVPVDDGGNGLYGLWYSARSSAGAWRFGYTTISIQ